MEVMVDRKLEATQSLWQKLHVTQSFCGILGRRKVQKAEADTNFKTESLDLLSAS